MSAEESLIPALRPLTWLKKNRCEIGKQFRFTLPEMGLRGPAKVISIDACPKIRMRRGRVVLATVSHFNRDVLEIVLEGVKTPLQPTVTHRLYSETRKGWIPAGQLREGERLRTLGGSVAITSIRRKPGVHRVYNLEVQTKHCYYVGKTGVLSHNVNRCAAPDNLSPTNYPNPDPPMSAPPVRYDPESIDEVIRMRQGKTPVAKKKGGEWIEGHHRQQKPVENGGVIDELNNRTHRYDGNHTRHNRPSLLTDSQRKKELFEHFKKRGSQYMTGNGEGI